MNASILLSPSKMSDNDLRKVIQRAARRTGVRLTTAEQVLAEIAPDHPELLPQIRRLVADGAARMP